MDDDLKDLKEAGLYNICFRNAGVGLMFFELERIDVNKSRIDWREGLVIHHYYPTLSSAVQAERKRLNL